MLPALDLIYPGRAAVERVERGGQVKQTLEERSAKMWEAIRDKQVDRFEDILDELAAKRGKTGIAAGVLKSAVQSGKKPKEALQLLTDALGEEHPDLMSHIGELADAHDLGGATDLSNPRLRSKVIRQEHDAYRSHRIGMENSLQQEDGRFDAELADTTLTLLGGDHAEADEMRGIVAKLKAEQALKDKLTVLSERGDGGQARFDPAKFKNLYKLFIDQAQVARGGGADRQFWFENERGYLAGAMNGFTAMLESLGQPATEGLLESLHDTCVDDVHHADSGHPLDRGFRKAGETTGYPVVVGQDGNFSEKGLAELRKKLATDPGWFRLGVLGAGGMVEERPPGPKERVVLGHLPQDDGACRRRAQALLTAYAEAIETARDDDRKLEAIARCCQDLDQAHTFADGNIRVIAFVLLNKLLIENGLSPTILKEPNRFDGYAVDELIADIKEGQATFRRELG